MKVILTTDVKGQGKKDELVEVSDGYARNFLFPKKLAIPADAAAINIIKTKEAARQHKVDVEKEKAVTVAAKLAEITLTIESAGGSDNRLYGSVTTKEISEHLKSDYGIDLDKRQISLAEPIKTFGNYIAKAKLYGGISADIKISVTAKKS